MQGKLSISIQITIFTVNLNPQSHEICFTNDFNSIIQDIILNTFTFTSSVLFGSYRSGRLKIIVDKSSTVLTTSITSI